MNPVRALDPISTGKIEELIFQLKEQYTIVIVTHNMPNTGGPGGGIHRVLPAGQDDRVR